MILRRVMKHEARVVSLAWNRCSILDDAIGGLGKEKSCGCKICVITVYSRMIAVMLMSENWHSQMGDFIFTFGGFHAIGFKHGPRKNPGQWFCHQSMPVQLQPLIHQVSSCGRLNGLRGEGGC